MGRPIQAKKAHRCSDEMVEASLRLKWKTTGFSLASSD